MARRPPIVTFTTILCAGRLLMLLLLVVLLGPAEACPERLHHLSLGRGVQLEVTTADLLLILLRDSCAGACHLIHRQKQHHNHEPSATLQIG